MVCMEQHFLIESVTEDVVRYVVVVGKSEFVRESE